MVAYPAKNGGKPCPAGKDYGACNTDYCPVDCAYSWGDYGDCSEKCGGGVQYKQMKVSSFGR
jgi:hypothetical protein